MRSIVLILVLPIVGCTTTPQEKTIDEILPNHLLHTGELWASKSITVKDYFPPEEVN